MKEIRIDQSKREQRTDFPPSKKMADPYPHSPLFPNSIPSPLIPTSPFIPDKCIPDIEKQNDQNKPVREE